MPNLTRLYDVLIAIVRNERVSELVLNGGVYVKIPRQGNCLFLLLMINRDIVIVSTENNPFGGN